MRSRSVWLLSALFLLHVQGCFSLSCPRVVAGTVGGSLSVQCHYEEKYKNNRKFLCHQSCGPNQEIVMTEVSEREVRNGRVSIRDDPASLSFTVTLEELRLQDAGTYQCGIDITLSWDATFLVEVRVSPAAAPTQSSNPLKTTDTLVPVMTLLPELTLPVHNRPSPPPRSQLSSVHSLKLLLLPVFLKLPLLLGTLGAVLWMKKRLQRAH
ncbi:CMRF35-like molecule 6 isoform X1 [Ochotona curzoniae]|uniref:CMRF35-like molecule 6 isoform X1 n=1 Tax=Ochotona curzoniae TaxID=130825 RepID=UPI001B34F5E1|nr:CMRF35-like molecule 6 isoform X1 [Ochotona curzoniae]